MESVKIILKLLKRDDIIVAKFLLLPKCFQKLTVADVSMWEKVKMNATASLV